MRDGKKDEGGGEGAEPAVWYVIREVRLQDVSVLRGSDCGAIKPIDDGGIAENV